MLINQLGIRVDKQQKPEQKTRWMLEHRGKQEWQVWNKSEDGAEGDDEKQEDFPV